MSEDQLFGDGKQTPATPDNVTPPQTDDSKNYYEELVGEDKKFKSNEDLAKGKFQSDQFIEQLKRENEGLRTELNSRLAVEQFVDQVIDRSPQGENQVPQSSSVTTPPAGQPPAEEAKKDEITPEKLNELVTQALESKLSEEKKKSNVEKAMQKAVNKYGENNFRSELSKKANELGLGVQFLASVAEQNPDTFINLMGLNETSDNSTQTSSQGNTSAVLGGQSTERVTPNAGQQKGKSYKDFEKLREANPAEYWSPRVQNEMFREIQEQGESFYAD